MQIDHRDGDGLNNRRSNQRLATNTQNAQNRTTRADSLSGFKSVSWHKLVKKWNARLCINSHEMNLGWFETKEAAAAAYNRAASRYFGEFARLNP
jgi:hypothetical protein